MAQKSKIEWTDATWNPTVGCSLASPGCTSCYAMKMAWRLANNPKTPAYHGTVKLVNGKPVWTGEINTSANFDAPLVWRKPKMIFVNSMSDLFHDAIKTDTIATIFAIAVASHLINGHTLQILTKRSERMKELMLSPAFWEQVNTEVEMHVMGDSDSLWRRSDDNRATLEEYGPHNPPRGIWLGVSVEDRKRRTRIDDLRWTPARVRIVSFEPLLEDLGEINLDGIHQGIVGGESAKDARPMHPDWVRSLRDQHVAASVAFFFKQWGSCLPCDWDGEDDRGGPAYNIDEEHSSVDYDALGRGRIVRAHGREFVRFPHKNTGRLLDNRTWDEFPRVAS